MSNKKKAIIFGASGQNGYFLTKTCNENNIEVTGVSRSEGNWLKGDVSKKEFVQNLIKENQPDFIFHLAANSTTRHSALFENHETISTGTLNILETVKEFVPHAKVFITGSGVQFKNHGLAIKETDEFEASSVYSVARIHSVYAARYYRSIGIKTYVGYLFHNESPLRKPHHISKMTTDYVKQILKGNNDKLILGDISVSKEWAFAGDIAEGIFTLVNQDLIHEATIGTGVTYSIQEWLEVCFGLAGKNWKEYIVSGNDNFVPEYSILFSNPETIFSLGWKPKTPFQQLAKIMMQ